MIVGPIAGAALLAGCAPQVARVGPAVEWPATGDRSFVLAPAPAGHERFEADATAAVRAALVARGFREEEQGRYRVDVGFAVNAKRVEIVRPADPAAAPPSQIYLCKRQRYALSVAMIDRRSPAVRRAAASVAGCRAPAAYIPLLVSTVLGPA